MSRLWSLALILPLGLVLFGITGCTPEPEPIRYGEDNCAYCKMTVTDPRYGSELVTATGKTHMFDSVECLAAYVQDNPDVEVHSLWVPDFRNPGTLMRVGEAFFIQSDQLKSPMALNIAAFRASASRATVRDSLDGQVMDWAGVRSLVKREWIDRPDGMMPHASMHRSAPQSSSQ